MITDKLQKGHLLIAEPSSTGDDSFHKSVVLLADHTEHGSVGFIINKPLPYTIRDLVPEIDADFKIYNGGPVEQDNLYFIHNIPEFIPNSLEISNGIYWGGDFASTRDLINKGVIHKKNIRFFLGYSGWYPNQLQNEMNTHAWIVAPNNYKNSIIGKSTTNFWKEKIMELGGDYLIWMNAPEDPTSN